MKPKRFHLTHLLIILEDRVKQKSDISDSTFRTCLLSNNPVHNLPLAKLEVPESHLVTN